MTEMEEFAYGKLKEIADKFEAQACVVTVIHKDGTIQTSIVAESSQKFRALTRWIDKWQTVAFSIIPFRTVFGWGNQGEPLPLSEAEKVEFVRLGFNLDQIDHDEGKLSKEIN